MLLYWMKLFNNLCFQMLNIDNSLSAKHSLVEQIHTVAVIKIISQSLKLFITCIGLSEIMITHFRDWSQTLQTSIQIAVETIIFHSLNSFCKIFQILQLYLTCSNRKRYWRYSIDVARSCLLKAGIDWKCSAHTVTYINSIILWLLVIIFLWRSGSRLLLIKFDDHRATAIYIE